MMNKKRTKEIGRTKYLMFIPLAALLMIISNIETVARTTEKIAADVIENVAPKWEQIVPNVQDTAVINQTIFEVVEKMPEFPGGISACMKFLSDNIKYPADAIEKKIEGRVVVQYVVNQDGSISDIKITRGVSPSLDAEAIRVVQAMPKWKPGMQRGQAVRVKYTMPIMFRLQVPSKAGEATPVGVKYTPIKVEPNANGVFEVVDQMPEFPGGLRALMEYISKNVKYPQEAHDKGIQGRVMVQIVIDAEGKVTDPKIQKGVDPLLDTEAIRITNLMPRWKPGMQNGKAVPVRYTFPIMFRLQ